MDEILYKASNQAMSFAIKSGISLASGYAIKTISKLLDKLPEKDTTKILRKRKRITTKINIISSSIELIRLISAQGNSTLSATMDLIEELESSFEKFDRDIEVFIHELSTGVQDNLKTDIIKKVETLMNDLIEEIDESVPLINLSLITCGVNRDGISLNKLIKASNYLSTTKITDSNFVANDDQLDKTLGKQQDELDSPQEIGPKFTFKYYSIFYNPSRLETGGSPLDCISWKEKFAKASVQIYKNPDHLHVIESFNDGRYHDDDESPEEKIIKLSDIDKIFFTSSGKILRLESNLPVLILKIGEDYVGFGDENTSFESDSEDEEEENEDDDDKQDTTNSDLNKQKQKLVEKEGDKDLSLLEYLIKLLKLEKSEKKSILSITDEKLGIYLGMKNDMDSNILKLNNLKINN